MTALSQAADAGAPAAGALLRVGAVDVILAWLSKLLLAPSVGEAEDEVGSVCGVGVGGWGGGPAEAPGATCAGRSAIYYHYDVPAAAAPRLASPACQVTKLPSYQVQLLYRSCQALYLTVRALAERSPEAGDAANFGGSTACLAGTTSATPATAHHSRPT